MRVGADDITVAEQHAAQSALDVPGHALEAQGLLDARATSQAEELQAKG